MIDNMMTRVKVNNEIDLCEIIAGKAKKVDEIRHRIEAALQYERISYFIRWQEPGFFSKLFMQQRPRVVFCVNSAQLDDALRVFDDLQLTESEVHMLGGRSKNKYVYSDH